MRIERDSLSGCRFASSRNSGKAICEKDWNWRPAALPDYDLWYIVAGKGRLQVNGTTYPLSPGSCFLLRPRDRVAAEQDVRERLTVIFVHFQCIPEGKETNPLTEWPDRANVSDKVWFETLLHRLLALDDSDPVVFDAIEFDAVLRTAICMMAREAAGTTRDNKHHAAIRRVIRSIRENPASPPGHAELAETVGLSRRYLNTIFKQQTGMSIKSFMARTRIERACQLLAESSMNVTRIAETLGYSDIYFFSKQFKQFIGESPLRYRHRVAEAVRHTAGGAES